MSLIEQITRAARTLPKSEQRQLVVILSKLVDADDSNLDAECDAVSANELEWLHPELREMVGIISADADADDIHAHRLRKHS